MDSHERDVVLGPDTSTELTTAVIFDFDDTLVDTVGSKIPAVIEYCAVAHGVTVTSEEVNSVWGIPFSEKMRHLAQSNEIDTKRYLEISERYPLLPFAESESVLTTLRTRCPIGIVTSLARPVLIHSLCSLGWNPSWFAMMVAEGEAPANKPDPRVFEPVLQSFKEVAPHSILYVGDALTDGHAAKGAGLRFVGVARSVERQRAFREAGFEYQTSLSEIPRMVRGRELRA